VGLALAPQAERPDILVEREGATAALRSDSGNLVFSPATAASYSAENWLLADGDGRDAASAADQSVFRCDALGCIGRVKGKTVALVRDPGALEKDCRVADIVIAPFSIGKRCRAARVIVDRRMLREKGAHALYIKGLSITTETVASSRGKRPSVPNRPERAPANDPGNKPGFSITADQPDQPALHAHAVRPENARLIGRIGGFERDRVAPPP
jgi:competence protein ComEC